MKKATIADLKNRLSQFLRYVKEGESVLILEREAPIAHIVPLSKRRGPESHRLADLEARGIIQRGDPGRLKKFLFPKKSPASGLLDALLKERKEGR